MGQPPRISTVERERTLDRLDQEAFDCVVVGGGITGAGVAREAAQRGLRERSPSSSCCDRSLTLMTTPSSSKSPVLLSRMTRSMCRGS